LWGTKETEELKNFVDPWVYFNTSTSKTMVNGGQDSIFGIVDFINDFPKTDALRKRIYNYVCRIHDDEARVYASVPCTAFSYNGSLSFFEFTAAIVSRWIKKANQWMLVEMRQEVIAERGDLQQLFEKSWNFENNVTGRIPMIRGEGDSPWLNIPYAEDVLSDEEKIKDTIIKNCYGEEWNTFYHCHEAISDYAYTYTKVRSLGDRKKEKLSIKKAARQSVRYCLYPVKFMKMEIVEDRAFVYLDRVRGLKQNSREYEYSQENTNVEHTCENAN